MPGAECLRERQSTEDEQEKASASSLLPRVHSPLSAARNAPRPFEDTRVSSLGNGTVLPSPHRCAGGGHSAWGPLSSLHANSVTPVSWGHPHPQTSTPQEGRRVPSLSGPAFLSGEGRTDSLFPSVWTSRSHPDSAVKSEGHGAARQENSLQHSGNAAAPDRGAAGRRATAQVWFISLCSLLLSCWRHWAEDQRLRDRAGHHFDS